MILAARFTFIVERSWKNMYFHPKLAWPPATYDVISRKHSNWPTLNLAQNVREGWTNSYWKRQVLMVYPLEKKLRKTYFSVATSVWPQTSQLSTTKFRLLSSEFRLPTSANVKGVTSSPVSSRFPTWRWQTRRPWKWGE